MKLKQTFLATLLFLFFNSCYASFVSGNDLFNGLSDLKNNTNTNKFLSKQMAIGYVAAMTDFLGNMKAICIPEGDLRLGQFTDITYRFLENNPDIRHRSAADLASIALGIAFPCKK